MASLYLTWGVLLLLGKDFFVVGTVVVNPEDPVSNCAGSISSQCPYTVWSNDQRCPDDGLANAAECRAAAQALGFTVSTFHEEYEDQTRPSGCSIGYGPIDELGDMKLDQVYFNKHPVGFTGDTLFRSICHNRVEVTDSFGVGQTFPSRSSSGEQRSTNEAYLGIVQNVTEENKCCEECWKKRNKWTQLYKYQAGNSELMYLNEFVKNACVCLFKEPHEPLINKFVDNTGIHSTGICAKEYTTCTAGDNMAGREMFIHSNCRDVCQRLYPASVGMTESLVQRYSHGKKKCWCEFGVARESEVVLTERYRTCLFDRQF